jgi:hypothetical protein
MPPNTWSPKRERQYEAIKESELARGRSPAKAKEIAARTVNKQRREAGETENKTSMGTGNPRTPFEERSRQELYNIAKVVGVKGRTSMKKADLIRALKRAS